MTQEEMNRFYLDMIISQRDDWMRSAKRHEKEAGEHKEVWQRMLEFLEEKDYYEEYLEWCEEKESS